MKKTRLALTLTLTLTGLSNVAQADDLYQIYQKALEKDPQLLQAAAARNAAKEAIGASRAALLPQIGLSAKYEDFNYNRDAADTDGTSGGIQLTQSIYNRDNWIGLDSAELTATQAEVAYNATKQGLMLRVADAYFDILLAMDNLELVQATKKAISRQLEQTKQRFAVGLTAITDVHEAQAEYDSVLADEIVSINTLQNSYETLRTITGIHHGELNQLNTERFSPVKPMPESSDGWVKLAEERNLQLLIQRIGVDLADLKIDSAKSKHLPTLSFTASQVTDNTTNNGFGPDSVDGTLLGVELSVPIYTGGAISSGVKVAQAQYVQTSEQLNQTYRSTVSNTINAYNNVVASISTVKAYEQTVVSRESSLQATEAGFEVGTRTIVDVLNSTRLLYGAKSQLSAARYGYILSILSLKQSAGTLNEEDLQMLNRGLSRSTDA